MATKTFKSTKPDSATLRQVATDAGRVLPAAVVRGKRETVLINLKVSKLLANALADRAAADRTTQKQIITRALAAAGLPVEPSDLEDLTPRRPRD